MNIQNFWKISPVVRLAGNIALIALAMSVTAALVVVQGHKQAAHATSGIILNSTIEQPWGVALDGANHLWVAEPGCDSSPVCANPPGTGSISEYDATTLTKINDFTPPSPDVFNPIFVAPDTNGNIWFTDPSHGAIGKLVPSASPSTSTWTEFSISNSISGAEPYDLVFDTNGHLWFADFAKGAIGEFDTGTNSLIGETTVPTSGANLYGITRAPDGKIWFAENNNNNIGSFTPPTSGTLATTSITEYAVQVFGSQPADAHLITVDNSGNVWFSTGFNGQIGELPAGTTTSKTYCVSTRVTSPHISGISVDNNTGKVWFDDSLNARVGYLDPAQYNNDCATNGTAGVVYTTFSASAHPHDGLLVDSQGNVFFTEQFGLTVGRITSGTQLSPSNPYPPGPTARTWYFAEGRVGGGFNEFITMSNPSSANQCIEDITYLPENGSAVTKQVTIPPSSRWTESVTSDMGTSVNGRGISVSAIIQNDPASSCLGVAAERPMYFNFFHVQSGSDVVGATHPANSFYFADVPGGGPYASFITVLNPPGGQTAHVTVNYYAGGGQIGTQSIVVNGGTRGTISVQGLSNLPQHKAAIVTSDQPVVVERPSYFHNVSTGGAGTVSGAASVIGTSSVQPEWFLAEGTVGTNSAGGKTQENLVISNIDQTVTAAANVTINLEYPDGTVRSFNVSVPPKSQMIWDVNAHNSGAPSNSLSADVKSTSGAGVIVERQMFFQYVHAAYGTTLRAMGVTDVTGQTLTFKAYSFAEGYVNKGYDEWLTLQNPTGSAETIYITIINGSGRIYNESISVVAHSRLTVDVKGAVLKNLSGNNYDISLTVQTLDNTLFVAERPMYWNASGAQGGTDVFGYAGT